MSILNVNEINPVGAANTITVNAANILASSSDLTLGKLNVSDIASGISTISTTDLVVNGNNYPTTGALSNRRININGAMQVAQRGTSFTGVNATAYHCDRYELYYQNSSAAFTVTQSTDAPDGFGKSLKIDVTTADTSIASNEEIKLVHKIEGFDVQRIIKGTASAVPITLSFYAKSTRTGTYVVELYDRDNGRDVSASYTISNTNWNRYELNYPADTGGSAFNDDNASSLEIQFWLVAGSAVQGGTLNTSWRTSSDGSSATGQINFTDSTINDWLITGIQLEVGSKATEFEHRSFGDELAKCQRYYETSYPPGYSAGHNFNEVYPFNTSKPVSQNYIASDDAITSISYPFMVNKRANPTVIIYSAKDGATGNALTYKGTGGTNINVALNVIQTREQQMMLGCNLGATNQASESYFHYTAESEL